MDGLFWSRHLFLEKQPRIIEQDGENILLLHCGLCARDYMRPETELHWQAAYVGVFQVKPLRKSVTTRWIQERCPGERLDSDADDRAQHNVARGPEDEMAISRKVG